MDKLVVHGGKRLKGNVKISGAKNAVLPIMASALIANGKSVISRVPKLRDTYTMIRLMEIIGAKCSFKDDIQSYPIEVYIKSTTTMNHNALIIFCQTKSESANANAAVND